MKRSALKRVYLWRSSALWLGVTEILGFTASACVVASMTSSSMVRLRAIGLVGAVAFIAYGLMAQAWPIVATNCATLTLHVLYLRRVFAERTQDGDGEVIVGRSMLVALEA